MVHAIDENAPVDFARFYPCERAVRCIPAIAAALHDAGFDVVAPRERPERPLVDYLGRGDCAPHEKRTLLPMALQKCARRHVAEQLQLHEMIIGTCQSKKLLA